MNLNKKILLTSLTVIISFTLFIDHAFALPQMYVGLSGGPRSGQAPLRSNFTADVDPRNYSGNVNWALHCVTGVAFSQFKAPGGSRSFSCNYSSGGTYHARIRAWFPSNVACDYRCSDGDGIYVNVSNPAPPPVVNKPPIGSFDLASCDRLAGWAFDPDTPSQSINIHMYVGSDFWGVIPTNQLRSDVNAYYSIAGNHGFDIPLPAALKDGNTHSITLYAIGGNGGPNALMTGSPRTVSCAAAPAATNIQISGPNYCISGPAATISWTYVAGTAQSAYRVIVTQGAATIIDTGKIITGSNAYFTGFGKLAYNGSYNAQVQVWDNGDNPSALSSPVSFTTPIHAYPQVNFSWSPQSVTPGENISFLDETVYAANPSSWFWDFGDGQNSANQNPIHKYDADGDKIVSFTVTDVDGYACQQTQNLGVKKEPPRWIEVLPR